MQIQINDYENRIQMFETDRAHTCTYDISEFLKHSLIGQFQRLQLQTSIALTLDAEIRQRKKDLILWQEKYDGVISTFARAYEERLAFYEETIPAFRECIQLERNIKKAEFELKFLKAKIKSKKRSELQLVHIRKEIQQANIVKFAECMLKNEKHDEIKSKLKLMEVTKKELVVEMFELQEKLKKQPFQIDKISSTSSVLNNRAAVSSMRMDTTLDIQKMREIFATRRSTVIERNIERNQTPIPVEKPKEISNDNPNLCIVLSNDEVKPSKVREVTSTKQQILPPLSSILDNQLRFSNRLSRPSMKSNKISGVKTQNYTEDKMNIDNVPELPKVSPLTSFDPVNETKFSGLSSDYLKNLKFTTQLPLDKRLTQKTMIPQEQNEIVESVPKRKLSQVGNIDAMHPPTKKRVNFSRPLEIHCDPSQSSQESHQDGNFLLEKTLPETSQEISQHSKTSQFTEPIPIAQSPNRPLCSQERTKLEKNPYFMEQRAVEYELPQELSIENEHDLSNIGSDQFVNSFDFSMDNFSPNHNQHSSQPPFSVPFFNQGPADRPTFKFSFDTVANTMKDTWDMFN